MTLVSGSRSIPHCSGNNNHSSKMELESEIENAVVPHSYLQVMLPFLTLHDTGF